ncbi:hypothetical protein SEA_ROSE5_125 [Mycobacterium phage Rose5]|nr:hypothetical protein SEA_ROSE5_125 [Mycobacterium phage Rose5]
MYLRRWVDAGQPTFTHIELIRFKEPRVPVLPNIPDSAAALMRSAGTPTPHARAYRASTRDRGTPRANRPYRRAPKRGKRWRTCTLRAWFLTRR